MKGIVRNVTGGEQMNFKLIAIIILVSIAAIFLVQNVAAVEVTFLLLEHLHVTGAADLLYPGHRIYSRLVLA